MSSTSLFSRYRPVPGTWDELFTGEAEPRGDLAAVIHGLGATDQTNWFYHGPRLVKAGYCVFATTYGTPGPALSR